MIAKFRKLDFIKRLTQKLSKAQSRRRLGAVKFLETLINLNSVFY